ncbi:MAG: DUF1189 family protein [Candidatus Woesearchaeota archaeon]
MKCPAFIKEITYSFHPKHLSRMSNESFWQAFGYVAKILAVAVVILLILFIPQFGLIPNFVSKQIAKFDNIKVSGNVSMTTPIRIPERDPTLIIDMTENPVKPGAERVLVTKEYMYYRLFGGRQRVETKDLKEPTENRQIVSQVLAILFIFILPSIVFYLYLALMIKYMILIFLAGTIIFFLLDLTHYRQSWWRMIKLSCYASTIVIAAEVISVPLSTEWLIPLFAIAGINIYFVGTLLLLIFTGIAAISVYHIDERKH